VHIVDDWKLKRTTVVRIERPNKTFVHFVCLFFLFLKQFKTTDLIIHTNSLTMLILLKSMCMQFFSAVQLVVFVTRLLNI